MISIRNFRAAPRFFLFQRNFSKFFRTSTTSELIAKNYKFKFIGQHEIFHRNLSVTQSFYQQQKDGPKTTENSDNTELAPEKMSLVARFKHMYKQYWYVLLPVHVVTSAAWLAGFYYVSKSGVDVIAIMNSLGFSDKITSPFKDSSLGHIAVAYLLYKVATPARYTVTLAGTTVSIKYLVAWGMIRPVNETKFMKAYQDKKEELQENLRDRRVELQEQMTDKKLQFQGIVQEKKNELQDMMQEKKTELQGIVQDKKLELEGMVRDKKNELEGIVKDKKTEFENKRQELAKDLINKDNVSK